VGGVIGMAKVCPSWFPKGYYKGQKDDGFYMHKNLKENLDLWIKNAPNDWDFVLIISGGGTVRVGKSVLAQQIAAYWHYQIEAVHGFKVPFSIEDNIVFHGSELIKKGNRLGEKYKYGCLIFDEAGADLEGIKVMKRTTQAVKDYLRECGQYNMLTILVLPEFFDLPKGIAISRSDALIDCYVTTGDDDLWERGKFSYFSRPTKKKLYRLGKKELNYLATTPDFRGDWDNLHTVDEEKYREMKKKALKTREVMSRKESTMQTYLKGALRILNEEKDLSYREIARLIGEKMKSTANHMYIGRLLSNENPEDEDD
jgi:hypothetical protein